MAEAEPEAEAEAEAPVEEEPVVIKKGLKVIATIKGKKEPGVVNADPAEGDTKVAVKLKSDGKVWNVPHSQLELA